MTKKSFGSLISNIVICVVVLIVLLVSFIPQSTTVSGDAPITKGASKTKVSLMINVYWGTEFLTEMLKIFEAHGVKTTFFVGGMWACENVSMLKTIYSQGHEIGNHGYYHKDHNKLDYSRNRQEIEITHKVVKEILGYDMRLFAPPSGAYNDMTLKATNELNYETIMWTLDTIDWRDQDEELIIKRATENISGGSLVLMHPTRATVRALDRILNIISGKGLEVAIVSETLMPSQVNS